MRGKLFVSLAVLTVSNACSSAADHLRGAESPTSVPLFSENPPPPHKTPTPWVPYAVERSMGAERCSEDPEDDSGMTRLGGVNRACFGLLPRHLAEVLAAIPEEHIFVPLNVRTESARRPQPYAALPGRGAGPDFIANVDILEGILLRSFEGNDPSDSVYLVIGPFNCIDDQPDVAPEGEYVVNVPACRSAHAETRIYKWSSAGRLLDVTQEYLAAPALTSSEQVLTAPFRPYLDTQKLARVPVLRWTINLRDASHPGRARDHGHDPVPMPDWVSDSRRFGDRLHLGFAVWNGRDFERRQRVPASLWPQSFCDPLRPDMRCRKDGQAQDGRQDPFVDEDIQ